MSNIPVTPGSGANVATDFISSNNYQQIKIVDGTVGSTTPLKINADGSITASIYGNITTSSTPNQSVSGTIITVSSGSIAAVIIGGSILTSSTANQSVSGTVGASIIGAVPIYISNTGLSSGSDISQQLAYPISISTGTNAPIGSAGYVFSGSGWDRVRGNASIGTLVAPYAFPSQLISGITSVITGTASVQVLAPAATGQRNYITNVLVTNAAAVGTTVELFDGGNVIYVGYAAASGGGFAVSFPAPLRQSSIAGNLSALSSIQASVYVSASGYTAS